MKKFFKILGIIFIITLVWSFIFFIFQSESKMGRADMRVIQIIIYLMGNLFGDIIMIIIPIFIYTVMLLLRKYKKVKLDNTILFFLGYSLFLIIELFVHAWLRYKVSMGFEINIELITALFYPPLILSLISYNFVLIFFKEKR
jgi:hypothetical protein